MVKKILLVFLHVFVVIILTVLTQVGGIIYLMSLFIANFLKFKFSKPIIFVLLYLMSTYTVVPYVASIFGRERINNTKTIKPTNYATILLNRNYVVPEMNQLLKTATVELEKTNPDIKISYLDACFPFIKGFPLLPHLSHNDGRKLDISLVYENEAGKVVNDKPSISGYGVFEDPTEHEYNQIDVCKKKGYWQYDFPKYLTLGTNNGLSFSESGTKQLINAILNTKQLGKLLIEPHLKTRLNLTDTRVRYHGCHAVRHDDHIHIQL